MSSRRSERTRAWNFFKRDECTPFRVTPSGQQHGAPTAAPQWSHLTSTVLHA
jgi:hypothetical protein